MKATGTLLLGLGVLLVIVAFTSDTTVYSGSILSVSDRTHNLGLLQRQMMILHTGLASFIAGAILFGCASVGTGQDSLHAEMISISPEANDAQAADLAEENRKADSLTMIITGIGIFVAIVVVLVSEMS